jgi:preprotein translocase subunit SecY
MGLKALLHNLPEVSSPREKKVGFNTKLKWTLLILVGYFILANIPLFGLAQASLDQFEYLAMLLGTSFGSIISLGIGPIVMASIILQLLVGSQIINIDVKTDEGKRYYQGLQKLLAFAFVIFEALIYVLMRGLVAEPGFQLAVIIQLCIGGVLIMFMDEVTQKWGFGSGISLFIAAGISWRLFAQLFNFLGPSGGFELTGYLWQMFIGLFNGDGNAFLLAFWPILITVVIFLIVIWAQSLKIEVPLAADRVRGYGVRWPLNFFYTGVMPVIFVSSLAASLQVFASLFESWLGHATFLGSFQGGTPISGLAFWIYGSRSFITNLIVGNVSWQMWGQAIGHVLFYVVFSVIFALFWVNTSNQDAGSQAKNILNSGLRIPGFRKDERVLESILKRYIGPLTVMGGMAAGLLASTANLLGALVRGNAMLLAIMILYQLYQNIAQQHAMDMNPALAGFFKG